MRAALWLVLAIGGAACGGGAASAPAQPQAQALADDARARCCAQCAGAAQRDPTGADIAGKSCTSYPVEWNGGPGVDDDCRAWFVAQPQTLTVGECAP
jgi:hypothetical protein